MKPNKDENENKNEIMRIYVKSFFKEPRNEKKPFKFHLSYN